LRSEGRLNIPIVSLFTGAGGLDLGLEMAGFSVKVCVEMDSARCATLERNRPSWKVLNTDLCTVSSQTILEHAGLRRGSEFIVSGAAPCSSFSKAAFWLPNRFQPYQHDPRRRLLYELARVIVQSRPLAFVVENVASLIYSTNMRYFEHFLRIIRKAGYSASWRVLNSAFYGVAQKRERVFIVGLRDGRPFDFPKPTHGPRSLKGVKPFVTSYQAIGDLDDGFVDVSEKPRGKWGHLIDLVPPGDNYLFFTKERGYPTPIFRWRSRYWSFLAKLDPEAPSWTIPAHPSYYGGPFHWRSRRLRIAEVKRIQAFPDDWDLPRDPSRAWAALGDATPPLLSKLVGRQLARYLGS
jgi:DNA (cytosine-5)-methyltransferase 1